MLTLESWTERSIDLLLVQSRASGSAIEITYERKLRQWMDEHYAITETGPESAPWYEYEGPDGGSIRLVWTGAYTRSDVEKIAEIASKISESTDCLAWECSGCAIDIFDAAMLGNEDSVRDGFAGALGDEWEVDVTGDGPYRIELISPEGETLEFEL